MLDLTKILGQLNSMSKERYFLYQDLKSKVNLAEQLLAQKEFDLSVLEQKSRVAKTSWLVAQPTESLQFYPLPKVSQSYQAIAVDGSQIAPDHHEIALCFLINVGAVLLSYGGKYVPIMESFPQVYHKEDELYQEFKGQKVIIQGEILAAKRASAEADILREFITTAKTRELKSIALFDGTMIHWKLESNNKEDSLWKNQLLDIFLASVEDCRRAEMPVTGYVSGSRSNDVVNLLRLGLCPEIAPNCDQCKYVQNPPCSKIAGITDVNLFKKMVVGERTSIFYSNSKVLKKYGDHSIGFFYLNVGSEVARVEAPRWVLENTIYLDFIHYTIFDQAQKGLGYPVALSEAHELAVIKGSDRQLFFNLLSDFYVQQGIPVEVSSKSLSKRRPVI